MLLDYIDKTGGESQALLNSMYHLAQYLYQRVKTKR